MNIKAITTTYYFTGWGGSLKVLSLAKRGLTVSTIRRRAAAIGRASPPAGHLPATSDPRVLTVMEGIARVHGSAPNKKTALRRDPLLELIDRSWAGTHLRRWWLSCTYATLSVATLPTLALGPKLGAE